MDPELSDAPPLPENAAHLWAYFWELSRARSHNGFGYLALQFTDIEAWSRMTRQKLDPWELNAILRLDSLYLESLAKKPKPEGQS
jgi:hypothetical protein